MDILVREIVIDDVEHVGIGLNPDYLPLYVRDDYGYSQTGLNWMSLVKFIYPDRLEIREEETVDEETIRKRYGFLLDDAPRPTSPNPAHSVVLPLERPPGA